MLNTRTELAYDLVTLDGYTSFWCVGTHRRTAGTELGRQ
jgi:hypothetical protein